MKKVKEDVLGDEQFLVVNKLFTLNFVVLLSFLAISSNNLRNIINSFKLLSLIINKKSFVVVLIIIMKY